MQHNRSTMVVLLDVLVILVLVLAARLESRSISVEVPIGVSLGVDEGVTVIAKLGPRTWEYWDNGTWKLFRDGVEPWRDKFFPIDCSEVCDQFRKPEHIALELILIGANARTVAFHHVNDCRLDPQGCVSTRYLVRDSRISIEKPD